MNDNDDYRRGPWNLPLPEIVTDKPIVVLIHDLKNDMIEKEFRLNYGNWKDRKFLGKLTYYAIENGRSVETLSPEAWDKMNK